MGLPNYNPGTDSSPLNGTGELGTGQPLNGKPLNGKPMTSKTWLVSNSLGM
jgi:hypothetical protein